MDIFDLIMDWRIMKPFYPVFKKYREGLLYLFFGGITFLLAIGVYILFMRVFGVHELVSNVISWVCGVTFSYFTTKKWVFLDYRWAFRYVISQMGGFYMARLATLLLQEVLIYIFISCLGWHDIGVKTTTEVINIVLNYFVSKFVIFTKGEK